MAGEWTQISLKTFRHRYAVDPCPRPAYATQQNTMVKENELFKKIFFSWRSTTISIFLTHFHHCDRIPDRSTYRRKDTFWLAISKGLRPSRLIRHDSRSCVGRGSSHLSWPRRERSSRNRSEAITFKGPPPMTSTRETSPPQCSTAFQSSASKQEPVGVGWGGTFQKQTIKVLCLSNQIL